ncbi:hypothetical protein M8818_003260 [Zalaria obscura]|uniref:Uncharacterized protein n=1 Tax=Zalaria obscura TaxID=2024903 RepID=A0ACC3SG30_9PEZI
MRGDLCRLIYEASNHRAKYIFDATIESFHQSDSAVEVRFADGRTDHFDLLVGADGQGSRTRKLLVGPDADGFLPLGGSYMGYFTIPRPVKEGEEYIATMYIAPGRRFIMTRRHSPHEMQVYLACSTNSEDLKNARGDVKVQKEILTELFQGAGWQTEEILKALNESDDVYLETQGLVKVGAWSQGRVVLVGDAAYCPSANTGMGTTSAMVGAYILAGEIGRHCGSSDEDNTDSGKGLATALEAYDRKFRPFMDQVQKGISKDNYGGMPSSAFGVAIWNWAIGLAALLRLNVFGEWILKEKG